MSITAQQTDDFKRFERLVGHLISFATWAWAVLRLILTGDWKGFLTQLGVGITGHILTESLAN